MSHLASIDTASRDVLQELAERYRHGVELADPSALAALYDPDVLVDTHVPNWRFQLQGRDAAAHRACVLPRRGSFSDFVTEQTESGLLVRFRWQQDREDGGTVVHQQHSWRLVDDRIVEQVVFCAGVWDPRLQALMAVEAPLVRP